MKITVNAKTKAKNPGVKRVDVTTFEVAVSESPINGKANKAITSALAKYLGVSSLDVQLTSGHSAKIKRFVIPDDCLPTWSQQSVLNI